MSKLQELIDGQLFAQYPSDVQQLEQMMKEYAEWYLEQYKQKLFENMLYDEFNTGTYFITENKIKQIPNPPYN